MSLLLEDVLHAGVTERSVKKALRDADESEDADTDGRGR